jgi:hypothetical protein
MVKKRFIVQIEVDEKNIAKKYPNYNLNWDNANDFIKGIMNDFKFDGDTNTSKDGIKEWGYSKKVIKEISMEVDKK